MQASSSRRRPDSDAGDAFGAAGCTGRGGGLDPEDKQNKSGNMDELHLCIGKEWSNARNSTGPVPWGSALWSYVLPRPYFVIFELSARLLFRRLPLALFAPAQMLPACYDATGR